MQTERAAGLSGVWALAWRSVVYLPLMVGMFLALLALLSATLLLPIMAAVDFCIRRFAPGLGALWLWISLLWAWRRFRLWRFFEAALNWRAA